MMKRTFESEFAFYEALWDFYTQNKQQIRTQYKTLTRKFLDYNDIDRNPNAFLRKPQFEALEMYVFIKEFLDNKQVVEIFEEWRDKENAFSDRLQYSTSKQEKTLIDDFTEEQTNTLFKQMEKYQEAYPNYIYALTMGLGKTILMATCIFYEFLLAKKYPKEPRYVHNALVFAPDKTVLESLREIVTFDKKLIVPHEYAHKLDSDIKFHFLEESGDSLHTLDDSDFNIVISNVQKIVVKKKRKAETPAETLFASANSSTFLSDLYGDLSEDEAYDKNSLIENQRFQKLTRLKQLGIYVDEAHHLFGSKLEKSLRAKNPSKTSLRDTINMLADKTSIVGCFNYTGTPYVNRQPLPEVVYAYGLREAIQNGYLKQAHPQGFENVKSEDFLETAVTEFWDKYGDKTYEGLMPKLAIFAAGVEEAQNEVRPVVERVIAKLGLPANKVLVNVGDPNYTKDEDIRLFNELDVPGSAGNERQFLILVNKGREGWNCRSLFGVAMFRSPKKSKIFVLQATMRCLRQITDEQQTASIFLSKDNFDILDSELEKNFHMDIDGLIGGESSKRKTYQVRPRGPERKIALKEIRHKYSLKEKKQDTPLSFGLKPIDDDMYEKYKSARYTKASLTSNSSLKKEEYSKEDKHYRFTAFTLVGELARYLNLSPVHINKILSESKEGIDFVVDVVNTYNEVLQDIIIPTIFHSMYDIEKYLETKKRDYVLLRKPKGKDYWEFKALPELALPVSSPRLTDAQRDKSFHADTYCFDSHSELECFWQYIESDQVSEVYFTGMFTSNQGDLAIQYYDPESQKIRSYYPDFVAKMNDGTWRLIEVKGDNKIDDQVVRAKAEAAQEMAEASDVSYIIYRSTELEKNNVLNPKEKLID